MSNQETRNFGRWDSENQKHCEPKMLRNNLKILFKNQIVRNKSFENKIVNVLVENQMKDKTKLFGRTEYMTPVIFDGNFQYVGKIVKVEITSSNKNTLFGRIKLDQNKKVA